MFKKSATTLLLFTLLSFQATAQKVGLVLSGGGAKGLTHIGVIRALEENNIPIDYITGTSMGAIVGSLYAMGYSPDEMIELLSSDAFKRWYSGEIEQEYVYHFKKNNPNPGFFDIRFSLGDSVQQVKTTLLPSSVVDPIQMNLAFLNLYAQATAACEGNFNRLFVPFRCIASDVHNKKQLVMRQGDLGDAVRASMTFPFMFKPIKINGVLAYDGGIYNNFPTDVMKEDFAPDLIIGSVVAANPDKPDESNLVGQLENMIMQKTDYEIPSEEGFLLKFSYKDVTLMDFHRIEELHRIGYERTLSMMDSIKARIGRRSNIDNVRLRRMVFRSSFPEFRFKNIYIEGADTEQQAYIKKEFRQTPGDLFSFDAMKEAYFRLLADDIITEIIPRADYNRSNDTYDLHLKVKMKEKLSLKIGGNISTSNSNQAYLGLTYRDLNNYAKELLLDGQIGKVYKNLQFVAKANFATEIPIAYRFIASLSTFDYFKKDKLFSHSEIPAFNQKNEKFIRLQMSLPFLTNKRAEFGVGLGRLEDRYYQSNIINFETDRTDKSVYNLFGGVISFNGNTLNMKQYATEGHAEALVAQIFTGKELYTGGTPDTETDEAVRIRHSWLQLSYTRESYYRLNKNWSLGWYLKMLFSSRNFSANYTATMMQAGDFSPTSHSQLTYNEAFRANQFVGMGIRPIVNLGQLFHLRGEFYTFMPVYPILRNESNVAYYGKIFSKIEYIGEISLVCKLPIGSISAYINHYSSPKREWNVGLNIGWQLFNSRFIE